MHLVLTDLLTCPRCGPDQGLIVLAERIIDRRILEGSLGCPNCESQYRIADGLADLRTADPVVAPESRRESPGGDDPMRLAALLGVTQGPAYALILGNAAGVAAEIAALVPGMEVIVVREEIVEEAEQAGVSRLLVEDALPLRGGSLRAVLVGTGVFEPLTRDSLRVLAMGARLVFALEHKWLEELVTAGVLRVLARDAEHVVTVRQR